MAAPFRYRLFGLTIASELELAELAVAPPDAMADVTIALDDAGPVGDLGQEPVPTDGGFVIQIAGVARYSVRGGAVIRVAPDPSAAPANVRLFLLGSAMGMLLHQRGLLPLHANAVEIDGRAFAFLGHSGAGKSTLAAWFYDRGHAVISDDVCVVRQDAGRAPTVSPGLPRLRLWRDALERSGRDPAAHPHSYSGDPDYDKFDVALCRATPDELPLAGVVLLRWGATAGILRLNGLSGVEVLSANTYRGAYVGLLGKQREHLQSCVHIAAAVPLFAIERTRGFERLPLEVDTLVRWAHATCVETE